MLNSLKKIGLEQWSTTTDLLYKAGIRPAVTNSLRTGSGGFRGGMGGIHPPPPA